MMVALRRADLLVAVGAELEVGWLPAAIQGASNPKILPGQSGYFEGAAQIDLIETGQVADRSRGDVHPMGNPHYYMDPARMATVGRALAARLGALDPAHRDEFVARAAARSPRPSMTGRHGGASRRPARRAWSSITRTPTTSRRSSGVPVLGYIEPLPGIPPTASHLRDLVDRLTGAKGVILYNSYHPSEGPHFSAVNSDGRAGSCSSRCRSTPTARRT